MAVVVLVAAITGGATPWRTGADAAPGHDDVLLVEPGGRWHLRIPGGPDYTFWYGTPGDTPLLGDWDGDGIDTPGAWRAGPGGGYAYLTNRPPADGSAAVAEFGFYFGIPGDRVFAGDWNGDGIDTLGVFRRGHVFLTDANGRNGSPVTTDHDFWFGHPDDRPLAGDLEDSGADGVFLYRPSTGQIHVAAGIPAGSSAVAATAATIYYGGPDDRFVFGDWDGNGIDTVGIFRDSPATVQLSNANPNDGAPALTDMSYSWGVAGWGAVAGRPGLVDPAPPPDLPVILAAGDIADCSVESDSATAAIAARFPDAEILALGDTVYEEGTATEFDECWGPTWGALPLPIHPAPGNHEYRTDGAAAYFDYFGVEPFYSFDVGGWHLISLNSEIDTGPGSPQHTWLQQDLADHPAQCTVAYWHTPRWAVANHQPGSTVSQPFWDLLDGAGVEIILNGHDHAYQRYTPMNAAGDPHASGIRQFVVGTGGADLDVQEIQDSRLEMFSATFGVLKLVLGDGSYEWEFLPVAGQPFTDSGTGACRP
jgi:hypothetical protein